MDEGELAALFVSAVEETGDEAGVVAGVEAAEATGVVLLAAALDSGTGTTETEVVDSTADDSALGVEAGVAALVTAADVAGGAAAEIEELTAAAEVLIADKAAELALSASVTGQTVVVA